MLVVCLYAEVPSGWIITLSEYIFVEYSIMISMATLNMHGFSLCLIVVEQHCVVVILTL